MAFDCVFPVGLLGSARVVSRFGSVSAGSLSMPVCGSVPHPISVSPILAFLADKDVAAILITHAHADHGIGALPLLRERFPTVPIYASPATIAPMRDAPPTRSRLWRAAPPKN